MTPGTLPARRRLRAAPLPVSLRVATWRFACWAICTSPESQESGVRSRESELAAPDSRLPTPDSIKQRTHRLIAVGVPNGLGQEARDREHLEPIEAPLRRDGDRIGD